MQIQSINKLDRTNISEDHHKDDDWYSESETLRVIFHRLVHGVLDGVKDQFQ